MRSCHHRIVPIDVQGCITLLHTTHPCIFAPVFLSLPYVLLANTLLLLVCVQSMAKRDHAKRMQSMREWTDDELRMLDKAVKKFPMGTPKRWEQVGDCV